VRDAEPERSRRHAAALDLELQRAGVALEDLAAARSGRRTPDRAGPVDVADLLRVAAETWTPMAAAWGVAIDAEEPAAWWVVHGDRRRLAQAIGNLVANAVEHGGGPVKLRARCGQPGRLLVEVVDRGSGPPGPWPPERRAHAGSRGHGLAVAARIAASCGGALVSAACDDGHAIALELPLLSGAGSGA
jgi:signal transduction histidine kinase